MLYKKYEQFRTALLIKTAIDNYPEGICFAAANGRPILANRRINELCHLLLGYTITNTNAMWNELEC